MSTPPRSTAKPRNASRPWPGACLLGTIGNAVGGSFLRRDTTASKIVPPMASLRSFELLAPLVPLFLESRKDEFQVAADVFATVHRMRERDTPNTPAAQVEPTDLCHRDFVGDLPHKASPAIVRGDNECVSFLAELSLKVRNFSERESFHDAIFEHLKAMVDQCTGWSRDECRLAARSTYRIGVDSTRSP